MEQSKHMLQLVQLKLVFVISIAEVDALRSSSRDIGGGGVANGVGGDK